MHTPTQLASTSSATAAISRLLSKLLQLCASHSLSVGRAWPGEKQSWPICGRQHTPCGPQRMHALVLRGSPSLAECKSLFLTKSKEQQHASGPCGYSRRSLTRRKRSRQHLSTPRHVVSLSRMSPAPLHGSQLARRLRAQ